MKKYIYSAFMSLLVLEVAFAQETQTPATKRYVARSSRQASTSGRVGINVPSPQQTLDIGGTLRVEEVPPVDVLDFEPLGWLPEESTGSASDQGKIVKIADTNQSPVSVARYQFHIQKTNEDWVNGVDLQIPKNRYTVILLDYALLEEDFNPVFLQVIGFQRYTKNASKPNDEILSGILFTDEHDSDRGRIGVTVTARDRDGTNDSANIDYFWKKIDIVTSTPLIMVYPDPNGNTWRFYADYPTTTPVSFDFKEGTRKVKNKTLRKYLWDVTFLIVDKTLMTRNPQTYDIDVGNDDRGSLNLRGGSGEELDPVTGLPVN